MRATLFVVAVLGLATATGCSSHVQRRDGDAAPAGSPSQTPSALPTATSPALTPTARPPSSPSTVKTSAGRQSGIRGTDWKNVTIRGLLNLGDVTFHGGQAHLGYNNCTMLPNAAKPAYADFIAEEPADSPSTEDALVLVECGGDGLDQALIPVQMSGTGRAAFGAIEADIPTRPDRRMTFTSYHLDRGTIVTTVKRADGGTEIRRYAGNGGSSWVRRA
jgi:hypothetical protein